MKDLMIDLETTDTLVTAGIISIAAIPFNIQTGDVGPYFLREIGLKNAQCDGTVSADTMQWWQEQDHEVRKQLTPNNPYPLLNSLMELSTFCTNYLEEDFQPWGNGSIFDIGILTYYYRSKFRLDTPWHFAAVRDVRTMCRVGGVHKNDFEFQGNAHDPIWDCLHQIKMVCKAHENLL